MQCEITMNNVSARLQRCFLAVFSELTADEVATATVASVRDWDSVASVTLFTMIEEEFGVALDAEALDEFDSFEHILSHVERGLQAQ